MSRAEPSFLSQNPSRAKNEPSLGSGGNTTNYYLQSCYIEIEQGFTKFTFSAAISKPLELKRSYIPLQKALSNSQKTQQSKLENLHPQCVKTGSNERGLSKEVCNSFLTQGAQKWQLVKVGSTKNSSILLRKGSFFSHFQL